MEESGGEQNQAWPYPIYVGHTRRLLPTDELFQDTSYAHDEGTKHAARASATAAERNSSHNNLQERSLARDFLVPKHECTLCRALLPTAHLLDLHLSEVHDSFFAAQAARKMSVYACLVESCLKKFCTIEQRKQHLMDFHKFPKGYNLDRIHLRRKKGQIRPLPQYQKGKKNNTSEEPSPPPLHSTNAELSAEPMEEDLVESMSRLRMSASLSVVPRSVAFGHRGRGGFMPGLVKGSKGSSRSGAGGGRGEKGEMASAGGDKDIEMNKE